MPPNGTSSQATDDMGKGIQSPESECTPDSPETNTSSSGKLSPPLSQLNQAREKNEKLYDMQVKLMRKKNKWKLKKELLEEILAEMKHTESCLQEACKHIMKNKDLSTDLDNDIFICNTNGQIENRLSETKYTTHLDNVKQEININHLNNNEEEVQDNPLHDFDLKTYLKFDVDAACLFDSHPFTTSPDARSYEYLSDTSDDNNKLPLSAHIEDYSDRKFDATYQVQHYGDFIVTERDITNNKFKEENIDILPEDLLEPFIGPHSEVNFDKTVTYDPCYKQDEDSQSPHKAVNGRSKQACKRTYSSLETLTQCPRHRRVKRQQACIIKQKLETNIAGVESVQATETKMNMKSQNCKDVDPTTDEASVRQLVRESLQVDTKENITTADTAEVDDTKENITAAGTAEVDDTKENITAADTAEVDDTKENITTDNTAIVDSSKQEVTSAKTAIVDSFKQEITTAGTAKVDSSKQEITTAGTAKFDSSKQEITTAETAKVDSSKQEITTAETAKVDSSKQEITTAETAKVNSSKQEITTAETALVDSSKQEITTAETGNVDNSKQEITTAETTKVDSSKQEITTPETSKVNSFKQEITTAETAKVDSSKQKKTTAETAKIDSSKQETTTAETAKVDSSKQEISTADTRRVDSCKEEMTTAADTIEVDSSKQEITTADTAKVDSFKQEITTADTAKVDSSKQASSKAETVKIESSNEEIATADPGKVEGFKGITTSDTPKVDSFEVYSCEEGITTSDTVKVNSFKVYSCEEGIITSDIAKVDSPNKITPNVTQMYQAGEVIPYTAVLYFKIPIILEENGLQLGDEASFVGVHEKYPTKNEKASTENFLISALEDKCHHRVPSVDTLKQRQRLHENTQKNDKRAKQHA